MIYHSESLENERGFSDNKRDGYGACEAELPVLDFSSAAWNKNGHQRARVCVRAGFQPH